MTQGPATVIIQCTGDCAYVMRLRDQKDLSGPLPNVEHARKWAARHEYVVGGVQIPLVPENANAPILKLSARDVVNARLKGL